MGKIADISKYQGTVDWAKAREELDFCILRASCGMGRDTMFELNAAGCTRYGIPFHVYHYLKALNTDEAADEADVFYNTVKNTKALFFVVDCEYKGITALEAKTEGIAAIIVEAFVERLKEHGIPMSSIAVYIGNHVYMTWGLDYGDFAYVWIPRYGSNDGEAHTPPSYAYDLWQYTSTGRLVGVTGNVDLNQISDEKTLNFFTRKDGGSTMNPNIQKVIDLAQGEVGYLEKATNSQLDDKTANAGKNNYTKYARDLAAMPYFNGSKTGVAWCAVFYNWPFVKLFGPEMARKMLCQPANAKDNCAAGCTSAMNYYKRQGRFFDTPEPGDQVFFGTGNNSTHTGMVITVESGDIRTIEGNTSSSAGVVANGGGVFEKKYDGDNSRILGYGRPWWNLLDGTAATPDTPAEDTAATDAVVAICSASVITSNGGPLNLRAGTSTSTKDIGDIPNGAVIDVLEKTNSKWWKVRHNGVIGHVSTSYLKEVETVAITLERGIALSLLEALSKAVGG